MGEKAVKLRVADALPSHVNRGIVAIDLQTKKELGIVYGDIIEIEGSKKTAAIAWPAPTSDIGERIIRMDRTTRENAGVSIGDEVIVRPAKWEPAKQIVLAPASEDAVILKGYEHYVLKFLIGRPLVRGDKLVIPIFRKNLYAVVSTNPNGIVRVTTDTQIIIREEMTGVLSTSTISYEDIGGLSDQIQKVREMIELPLRKPELFRKLGIEPPKGILLYGPPGTGKTLLAKAVATEANAHFIALNGPEIMSKFVGEAEEKLRKIFEEARRNAPTIIFIDEIDAIAPKREEVIGEVERRVVAQLLTLMDGLEARGDVIVIAATNRPNAIDPALRRPGRFDREIELPVPDKRGRFEILQIHTRHVPLDVYDSLERVKKVVESLVDEMERAEKALNKIKKGESVSSAIEELSGEMKEKLSKESEEKVGEVLEREISYFEALKELKKRLSKVKNISEAKKVIEESPYVVKERVETYLRNHILWEIAERTHGFVGADLAALVKEAAMKALRRVLPKIDLDKDVPEEVLEELVVKREDFEEALKEVRPSALREVFIEVPNIKWEDIGGLDTVKKKLREVVEYPLKHRDVFQSMGIEPPKGILLYGPPGTGKTLLAKAVATESEANFIAIKGPEILSKWVGESERAIREVFQKARQSAPTIIFIDEIDAIAPIRGLFPDSHVTDRIVNQLLTEMDGIAELKDVVVIAATNRPDIIDPSLLRPGRFDRIIYVPPPDKEARKSILRVHLRNVPTERVDLDKLSELTENYSGADLAALVREAVFKALEESGMKPTKVKMKHFEEALKEVRPSLDSETVKWYEEFYNQMKRMRRKVKREESSYIG